MKKILLNFGKLLTIITPLLAIISCNSTFNNDIIYESVWDGSTLKYYKITQTHIDGKISNVKKIQIDKTEYEKHQWKGK